MHQEVDIGAALGSAGVHETIRTCGRFGSPPSACREAAGRGLVDPGCRGGCWREPAIGEQVEKARGVSRRDGQGARREAATCAAVSALPAATGRVGPTVAGRAAEGGVRLGPVDHGAGRGTGRAKVWRVVPPDASRPNDARLGIFVPEAPTAEQRTEPRGGSGVARAEVAADKKGGNKSKLAWSWSMNRASCCSRWYAAPGPRKGERQ